MNQQDELAETIHAEICEESLEEHLDPDWPGPCVKAANAARADSEPAPCNMTHTPPFDFAQCETHDTTFPLGDKCKFDGRDMVEVYADEADEQRARAVRAEMELERVREALDRAQADGEEWGVQYERKGDPTMDNPSGIVTSTTVVSGRSHAEQAVQNRAPISAQNRRVVRRIVTPWEVA